MGKAKHSNRLIKDSALAGVQLTNAVSELCRQADAFLLVIDASCGPSKYVVFLKECRVLILLYTGDETDRYVLDAMLQSGREYTPILVVNVSSEGSTGIHTPLMVADALHMCQFANHPWQV
jgi:hypothetical protein